MTLAILSARIKVELVGTLLNEGSGGNLGTSGVHFQVFSLFHIVLFLLHGELLPLLNPVLSLKNILLGLVVEESEAEESEY